VEKGAPTSPIPISKGRERGGPLSCLPRMGGKEKREGSPLNFYQMWGIPPASKEKKGVKISLHFLARRATYVSMNRQAKKSSDRGEKEKKKKRERVANKKDEGKKKGCGSLFDGAGEGDREG